MVSQKLTPDLTYFIYLLVEKLKTSLPAELLINLLFNNIYSGRLREWNKVDNDKLGTGRASNETLLFYDHCGTEPYTFVVSVMRDPVVVHRTVIVDAGGLNSVSASCLFTSK